MKAALYGKVSRSGLRKKKKLTIDYVLRRVEVIVKWSVVHGVLRLRSHADITEKSLTALRSELIS